MRTPYQNELMHSDRPVYPNELMHYGIQGMRWGFTKGHKNGGRTAAEFFRDLGTAVSSLFGGKSSEPGSGGRGESSNGGGGKTWDDILEQKKQDVERFKKEAEEYEARIKSLDKNSTMTSEKKAVYRQELIEKLNEARRRYNWAKESYESQKKQSWLH